MPPLCGPHRPASAVRVLSKAVHTWCATIRLPPKLDQRSAAQLQVLQEELQATSARHTDEAAETEARLRTKHGLAVACLHETHEADLELLRRKVSDAQGDAAELRQAVAKHKADADALLVRSRAQWLFTYIDTEAHGTDTAGVVDVCFELAPRLGALA